MYCCAYQPLKLPHARGRFFVSHELGAVGLSGRLERLRNLGEPGEDRLDVAAVLHGDDAAVVLFVHPAQRGLGFVVEDTAILFEGEEEEKEGKLINNGDPRADGTHPDSNASGHSIHAKNNHIKLSVTCWQPTVRGKKLRIGGRSCTVCA